MTKQVPTIQITITSLDVYITGMVVPRIYAATDESSRLMIATHLYDGASWQNLTDFIKGFDKPDSNLALEL